MVINALKKLIHKIDMILEKLTDDQSLAVMHTLHTLEFG